MVERTRAAVQKVRLAWIRAQSSRPRLAYNYSASLAAYAHIMRMRYVHTRSTPAVCFTKARETHSTVGSIVGGAPLVFAFYRGGGGGGGGTCPWCPPASAACASCITTFWHGVIFIFSRTVGPT